MRYRLIPCLAFISLAVPFSAVALYAQKVELVKCERPKSEEQIASFSVVMPLPVDKAQSRVVRAFVEVGITPTEAGKVSNSVEWDSGVNDSGLGYRRRVVRATIFEEDDGTSKVIVVPIEHSHQGGGETTHALDQWNSGYGYKVWCAAKIVVDSLTAASDRIRLRKNAAAATVEGSGSVSQ
jgi:hypothetical protein